MGRSRARCAIWRLFIESASSNTVGPRSTDPPGRCVLMTADPPTCARPSLVLFALAVGGFAIGTTEFATMSLLRFFARDLHIDEPTAGHVISAYALGVVVGAPCIAVLSAR